MTPGGPDKGGGGEEERGGSGTSEGVCGPQGGAFRDPFFNPGEQPNPVAGQAGRKGHDFHATTDPQSGTTPPFPVPSSAPAFQLSSSQTRSSRPGQTQRLLPRLSAMDTQDTHVSPIRAAFASQLARLERQLNREKEAYVRASSVAVRCKSKSAGMHSLDERGRGALKTTTSLGLQTPLAERSGNKCNRRPKTASPAGRLPSTAQPHHQQKQKIRHKSSSARGHRGSDATAVPAKPKAEEQQQVVKQSRHTYNDTLRFVRAAYGMPSSTAGQLAPTMSKDAALVSQQQRVRAEADIARLRARVEAAAREAMDRELCAEQERRDLTTRMGWDNVRARVFDMPERALVEPDGGLALVDYKPLHPPTVPPEMAHAAAVAIRAAQDTLLATLADRQKQAYEAVCAEDAHKEAMAAAAREAAMKIVASTLDKVQQAGGVEALRERSMEERHKEQAAHADYIRRRMKTGAAEAASLRRALDLLRRRVGNYNARVFACPDAGYGEFLRRCMKEQGWVEASAGNVQRPPESCARASVGDLSAAAAAQLDADGTWQVVITRKMPARGCVPGQVLPQLPQLRAISTKGGLATVMRKQLVMAERSLDATEVTHDEPQKTTFDARTGAIMQCTCPRTYDLSCARQLDVFRRDYQLSTAYAILACCEISGEPCVPATDSTGWASGMPDRCAMLLALRYIFTEGLKTGAEITLGSVRDLLREARIEECELTKPLGVEEYASLREYLAKMRDAGLQKEKPGLAAYFQAEDSILVRGESPPEVITTLYVVEDTVKVSLIIPASQMPLHAETTHDDEDAVLQCLCVRVARSLSANNWQASMNGPSNIWVCKPIAAARGEGIHVCDTFDSIMRLSGAKNASLIVQKYLERPAVHSTSAGLCKIDLRVWVACLTGRISSAGTKVEAAAYVYDAILVRVASCAHTLRPNSMHRARAGNASREVNGGGGGGGGGGNPHLCNRALSSGGAEALDLYTWLEARAAGLESGRNSHASITTASRTRILDEQRSFITSQIRSQVSGALRIGAPSLFGRDDAMRSTVNSGLELLGFDFLIDADDRCYLLEVNEGPDLRVHSRDTPGDAAKASMMSDLVGLYELAAASAEIDAYDVAASNEGGDLRQPAQFPDCVRSWRRVV